MKKIPTHVPFQKKNAELRSTIPTSIDFFAISKVDKIGIRYTGSNGGLALAWYWPDHKVLNDDAMVERLKSIVKNRKILDIYIAESALHRKTKARLKRIFKAVGHPPFLEALSKAIEVQKTSSNEGTGT